MVRNEMAHLVSPRKLGFGVHCGVEAYINSVRRLLLKMAAIVTHL